MQCPRCADDQPADAHFCARCGADLAGVTPTWQGTAPSRPAAAGLSTSTTRVANPAASPIGSSAAPSSRRAMPWIAGALVSALVVAAALVAVNRLTRDDATSAAAGVASTEAPLPAAVSQPPISAVGTLRATAEADMATVEALVGQWVPQVSQRRVGSRTGGLAMRASEIVELHSALQQSVGAVLVDSGDYVSRANNLWISIVPEGFATANAALDRCGTLPTTDQPCVARFITHDESVTVITKQRRS